MCLFFFFLPQTILKFCDIIHEQEMILVVKNECLGNKKIQILTWGFRQWHMVNPGTEVLHYAGKKTFHYAGKKTFHYAGKKQLKYWMTLIFTPALYKLYTQHYSCTQLEVHTQYYRYTQHYSCTQL